MFSVFRDITEDELKCTSPQAALLSPLVSNQVVSLKEAAILSGNKGIDSSFQYTIKDVKSGVHRVLFSAPEAIVDSEC